MKLLPYWSMEDDPDHPFVGQFISGGPGGYVLKEADAMEIVFVATGRVWKCRTHSLLSLFPNFVHVGD